MQNNMTQIQCRGLFKSINNIEILHDIDFNANTGDVIALIGSSGSGKSTLLRCLNLLTLPDAGELEVNGVAINFGQDKFTLQKKAIARLRQQIGMVFQQFNLWPHLSVLDNMIAGPVYVLKKNKNEMIAEAEKLLSKVGLLHKRDCYPAQLSGGQQQRVAIVRSLMMKPQIMLFDELTSALDPEMTSDLLKTLEQLSVEGMTMIIATHELNFARKIANRVIFLDEGRIVEQGETQQVFHCPQSARLRQFISAIL